MPKVYRGMFASEGHPKIGSGKNLLGVVTPDGGPPGAAPDVIPDQRGHLTPGSGGMSVAPTAADLPAHRLPARLRDRGVFKARGDDKLLVWSLGIGPYLDGPVAEGLRLRLDSDAHALVEPIVDMHVDEFRQHLAATVNDWVVDEP